MFDQTSWVPPYPAKLSQNELSPKGAFVGHQEIMHNIADYLTHIKITEDVIMVITV